MESHNSGRKSAEQKLSIEQRVTQISECPISLESYIDLEDPVLCRVDGQIYSKQWLTKLIESGSHVLSPVNRKPITLKDIEALPPSSKSLIDSLKESVAQIKALKEVIIEQKEELNLQKEMHKKNVVLEEIKDKSIASEKTSLDSNDFPIKQKNEIKSTTVTMDHKKANQVTFFNSDDKKNQFVEKNEVRLVTLEQKQLHNNLLIAIKDKIPPHKMVHTIEFYDHTRTHNKPIEYFCSLLDPIRDINEVKDDKTNASPLLFACLAIDTKLVKELLQRGADPNILLIQPFFCSMVHGIIPAGTTPLISLMMNIMFSCEGLVYIANTLLEYKANINAVDINGDTALHYAVRQGDWYDNEMVPLLTKNPMINPTLKNNKGKTPLDEVLDSNSSKLCINKKKFITLLLEAEKNHETRLRDPSKNCIRIKS